MNRIDSPEPCSFILRAAAWAKKRFRSNSFCRYFKSKIKKTFSDFLIEIRIEHARKLLAETDMPVAKICFECGYNCFSNFNKQFKTITNRTPIEYRKYCRQTAI